MRASTAGSGLGLWMLAAAVSLASGLACDQPGVRCQTARGDFAVRYVLVSGSGPCSELTAEIVGLQTYASTVEGTDFRTRPDWDFATIALQPTRLGDLRLRSESQELPDPDNTHRAYGVGRFVAAEPDVTGMCLVPSLSEARQNLPLLPAVPADAEHGISEMPEQPPTNIAYRFSNVEFMVTPDHVGTQFRADLVYEADGCTARYRAWGVNPVKGCGGTEENPSLRPERCLVNDPAVDQAWEYASPDFALTCDQASELCVPEKEPPSLR